MTGFTVYGYSFSELRKVLVSVVGFVVAVLTAATTGDLVPARWLPLAVGVIGVGTSVGVFLARNADRVPVVVPVAPVLVVAPGPVPPVPPSTGA